MSADPLHPELPATALTDSLALHMPYVWAHGIDRATAEDDIQTEAEHAVVDGLATNLPDDITHHDDWQALSDTSRAQAHHAEQASNAVVVLDEHGQPVRVWWRVACIADPAVRGRLDRRVAAIRAAHTLTSRTERAHG